MLLHIEVFYMKNKENFLLLTILATVGLVGILLMINNAGTESAGQVYSANSVNIHMTSEEEYLIYDKKVILEYVDANTIALSIDGTLVKVPNGEKVTYDGLGMFSYNGEEVDKINKIYVANVDFYK